MGQPADSSRRGHYPDVGRVILSRRAIARGVSRLARQITECYGADELTLVTVLKGSIVFLSDLIRRLAMPVRIEFVGVQSYPGRACRSQGPTITLPPTADFAGRHVLIVDDILDSGRTLQVFTETVASASAASVRSCVLLRKDRPGVAGRRDADFVGFDIPDSFVVGYGLDFDGLYRNLPDVRVLKPASRVRRPASRPARSAIS
jgi:hypoxanthine phosphoribosyltransferase